MFTGELAVAFHVARDFRLRQQGVEFLQPLVGASELVGQGGFHSWCRPYSWLIMRTHWSRSALLAWLSAWVGACSNLLERA